MGYAVTHAVEGKISKMKSRMYLTGPGSLAGAVAVVLAGS